MPDAALVPLEKLLARLHGDVAPHAVTRRVLRGGLEAAGVEHVVVHFDDVRGRRRRLGVIAKQLVGRGLREEAVYRRLLAEHEEEIAPRMLGSEPLDGERAVLFLEPIRGLSSWPWRDVSMSERLFRRLARFHARAQGAPDIPPSWDYDAELEASARASLESLARCRHDPSLRGLARAVPWARRLVLGLPRLRRQLLQASLGSTMLHGDLHSGNVIMRRQRGEPRAVMLDWGRARVGSPLEDVGSWLQSLGHWEPEAMRRHDTLFAHYLRAAGHPDRLTTELRESYWLACASNALAGALSYHLQRAQAAATERERARAHLAARDALRVLRRADAVWS